MAELGSRHNNNEAGSEHVESVKKEQPSNENENELTESREPKICITLNNRFTIKNVENLRNQNGDKQYLMSAFNGSFGSAISDKKIMDKSLQPNSDSSTQEAFKNKTFNNQSFSFGNDSDIKFFETRKNLQNLTYCPINHNTTSLDKEYHERHSSKQNEKSDSSMKNLQYDNITKKNSESRDLNLNELYTNFEMTSSEQNFKPFTEFLNPRIEKNDIEKETTVNNLEPGEIDESDQMIMNSRITVADKEQVRHQKRNQGRNKFLKIPRPSCSNSNNIEQENHNSTKSSRKRKKINSPHDREDKNHGITKRNKSLNHFKEPATHFEYDIIDDLDLGSDVEYDEGFPDGTSESDYNDVPEEEIDAMLDEGLDAYRRKNCEADDESQSAVDDDDLTHEEREKVVLKVRGHDHFEILPEGWIEVTHNSGMPVYLHKVTRVCTLSKPYFLGPGSARKHEIPLTAIPCLHYRREIEKEKTGIIGEEVQPAESSLIEGTNSIPSDGSKAQLPSAKIESVLDNNKEKSLDHLQVRKYCEKLFEFQTITVRRFKTWAGRRKHQKLVKQLQRPTLPSGTKLITCPLPPPTDKDETSTAKPRREFTMNPNGKSHVCILHEYVQHAMRVQPKYIFKELENAKKPYGATVIINDMEYGTGYGSSKKQAKSEAAKATLEILIPQIRQVNSEEGSTVAEQQDLAFFDEVRIEDPRISELCAKAGQPSPYQILLECLKRNYGMGDTEVKLEMQTLKHQKNEFTMTVGKHTAKVICKNKRDGKQRASQAILQSLHSHIRSWGSLLRLYGKGSCKTLKEKKLEEQQITELQSRASANRPNLSILNKLKEEMLKLKEKREAVKPIGKFMPGDVELPLDSGCNLQNLDL